MRIEKLMDKVENKLSKFAAVPMVGTAAGAIKVLIGVTQSLSGLVLCGLTSLLPSSAKQNDLKSRSFKHLKHGLGNIAAGTVEAVPGVGTYLYYVRKKRSQNFTSIYSKDVVELTNKHKKKWMPYQSIVLEDLEAIQKAERLEDVQDLVSRCRKINDQIWHMKERGKSLKEIKVIAKKNIKKINDFYTVVNQLFDFQ